MKYEKALADLRAQVRPGEQLLMWTKATMRQPDGKSKGNLMSGALILTDQRLAFLGSQLMEKASFAIPVQAVTSVDHHRQAIQNYTVITVQGGVQHRFFVLPGNLLAKLDELRFSPKTESPRPRPAPGPGSAVGDLGRLVDLHAAGHLSDVEFAAAKARLLGI